jgi:segregation and condensation protein B
MTSDDPEREPIAVGPGRPREPDRPAGPAEPGAATVAAGAHASDSGSPDDEPPDQDGDAAALDRLAGARPGPGAADLSVEALEALLFVAERPLSRREIASVAGVDTETVDAVLGDLEVALRTRGIRLIASGERVQLATAPEAGELIARYTGAEGTRLSPAALETLAIVAYRQPVTRGGIERIRGVDSDYVVRSLLHRRLVMEVGRAATPGRPILYGTGFDFLERFGLTSLDELPVLDTDVAARLAEEGAQEAADAEVESAVGGPAGTDPAPAADGSDEA